MSRILRTDQPDFEAAFQNLLAARKDASADVAQRSAQIIDRVRSGGDPALFALTEELDGCTISTESIRIGHEEIASAVEATSPACREAIDLAADRIADYHRRQRPEDHAFTLPDGSLLGWRWRPVDSAGIYVPGGSASYPSSVLMNAVPAKVAGVQNLVMTVPTPGGTINPLVLYAAHRAGVDVILRIGGAQAIAALAYGTQSVPAVDMITGPGNAYVTAAKKLVYGEVGIDLLAGPSEVVIIADDSIDPEWIAADLLAQAEHDQDAQSILLTTSANLAVSVADKIARQLRCLPRRSIASASWEQHGALVVVRHRNELIDLANRVAAEHLQVCADEPQELIDGIRHAGAIFSGAWTPEAIGDYVAGPNHVLPTSGTARFASGLSILNFMKRTTITRMSSDSFANIALAGETLAVAEGLDGHARSLRLRLEEFGRERDDRN